jgi:hypothetical protein
MPLIQKAAFAEFFNSIGTSRTKRFGPLAGAKRKFVKERGASPIDSVQTFRLAKT